MVKTRESYPAGKVDASVDVFTSMQAYHVIHDFFFPLFQLTIPKLRHLASYKQVPLELMATISGPYLFQQRKWETRVRIVISRTA